MSGSNAGGLTAQERVASALAGSLVTSFLMTPLDVVKVRMQAAGSAGAPDAVGGKPGGGAGRLCSNSNRLAVPKAWWLPPQHINAMRDCTHFEVFNGLMEQMRPKEAEPAFVGRGGAAATFRGIVRAEGVAALWRGLAPTLVASVPATVLYFNAYEEAKALLLRTDAFAERADLAAFVAGSGARVVAATVVAPLELLRTRVQARHGEGLASVVRQAVADVPARGVLSLWRGLGASILRDVPFSGLYWLGYERAQLYLTPAGEHRTPLRSFAAGAASGSVAAAVTTPFDVLKTRMQVEMYRGGVDPAERRRIPTYRSILTAMLAEEGASVLWRGTVARVARVAPSCGIMIGAYEAGKRYFGRQHDVKQ